MYRFVVVSSVGIAQRTGVNLQGHNSDNRAVGRMSSSECAVIREFQSPVAAAGCLRTAIVHRENDETAVKPQLIAGRLESEMLDMSELGAERRSTNNIETTSSFDASHSMTPAVSSVDRPPHQPSSQCPVKLNGISNTEKSADTCSGTCC